MDAEHDEGIEWTGMEYTCAPRVLIAAEDRLASRGWATLRLLNTDPKRPLLILYGYAEMQEGG